MKITKDCYVDVSGWTEEEVVKAAEMFAKVGGGGVGNIDVEIPDDDYKYLMILEGDAFVGDSDDLHEHGCVKELTKQDIFEEQQPQEWNGEGLPPAGTECEVCVGDSDWREACVLAVDHNIVVVRYNGDWGVKFNGFSEGFYRPIKSEKDKEIEKIDDVIDEWQDEVEMMAEKSLAEHLYENGFRFVEES